MFAKTIVFFISLEFLFTRNLYKECTWLTNNVTNVYNSLQLRMVAYKISKQNGTLQVIREFVLYYSESISDFFERFSIIRTFIT